MTLAAGRARNPGLPGSKGKVPAACTGAGTASSFQCTLVVRTWVCACAGKGPDPLQKEPAPSEPWDGLQPAPGASPPPRPAPPATGAAPRSPGPGTALSCALGGGRAAGSPCSARSPGCSSSTARWCWGTQRRRAPRRGSFLQASTVRQSRGDGGFPGIVSAGSLGTERARFWNKQRGRVLTRAHNGSCAHQC